MHHAQESCATQAEQLKQTKNTCIRLAIPLLISLFSLGASLTVTLVIERCDDAMQLLLIWITVSGGLAILFFLLVCSYLYRLLSPGKGLCCTTETYELREPSGRARSRHARRTKSLATTGAPRPTSAPVLTVSSNPRFPVPVDAIHTNRPFLAIPSGLSDRSEINADKLFDSSPVDALVTSPPFTGASVCALSEITEEEGESEDYITGVFTAITVTLMRLGPARLIEVFSHPRTD